MPGLHGRHGDARFVGADDASGQRVLRSVIVLRLPSGAIVRCPSSIDRGRIVSQRSKAVRASHQALRSSARVRRPRRRESERTLENEGGYSWLPSFAEASEEILRRRRRRSRAGVQGARARSLPGRLRTMQILISFLRARGHLDRRPGLRQLGGRNRDPDRSSGQVGQHSEGVFPWPTTKPW